MLHKDAMETQYAGFWRRVAASLVDSIFIAVLVVIETEPSFGWNPIPPVVSLADSACPGIALCALLVLLAKTQPSELFLAQGILARIFLSTFLLPTITSWLYRAVMECSPRQATLGKMLLKIQVTDCAGHRVSFGRATARHFSKIISTMLLLIGFLMVAWTKKKQALHDKIAGCLVVRPSD